MKNNIRGFSRSQRSVLKKMNFISDQSGIVNRYLREEQNWEPHLNNTRQFILGQVKKNNPWKIVILGSGWWLDVPVDELHELCSEILLVDIHHPPQMVHKALKYEKIQLIEADLTGDLVFEFFEAVRDFKNTGIKKSVNDFHFPLFDTIIKSGYYISLNIIDQMDILIVDYLKKHSIYTPDELLILSRKIQEAHIGTLHKNHGCLVGDREEITIDKDGRRAVKPVFHVTSFEGKILNDWTWEFDNSGTYNPGKKTHFNVFAAEF